MTTQTLNEQYQALIDQFTVLNQKIGLFINGPANQTVQTDAGPVKTLAGIAADAAALHYVQKIVDYRLWSQANSALGLYDTGTLFRVYGDTETLSGIWEKKDNGGMAALVKVSYSDIYDLRDIIPAPWNYLTFNFTKTDFDAGSTVIAQRQVQSSANGYTEQFVVEVQLSSTKLATRGVRTRKFNVSISAGAADEFVATITSDISYGNSLDPDFEALTQPTISITDVPSGGYHNITAKVLMTGVDTGMTVSVRVIGPNGKSKA